MSEDGPNAEHKQGPKFQAQGRDLQVDGESFSAPLLIQSRLTLWVASLIMVIGTALIDPHRLLLLAVPLSFLLTAYGAGTLLSRATGGLLRGTDDVPLLDIALHLGVGIACLSLVAVVTALCGVLWIAGVVGVILMGFGCRQAFRAGLPAKSIGQFPSAVLSGLAIGALWLVAWLWATIPPTFFDELAYHLVIPQRSVSTGTLQTTPWVFFTLMPHASDLLLAWGMSFAGPLGARATLFALWVACSLSAWGLAELIAPPRSRSLVPPFVAGALATSPTLWFLATLPFAETCLALAMVTAIAVIYASATEDRAWVPLGLVLGLAATVKLAGLYWVAAGIAAALFARWPVKYVARASLVAVGSVLPWWIRGAMHTGNPIYPMGYEVLGGAPWSDESQARMTGDLAPSIANMDLMRALRLPLDLIQHPERFGSAGEAGALAVLAVCLVLALPALLWFANITDQERRHTYAATAFMLIAAAGWMLTSTTARFFAPALVISLAVLVGASLRLGPRMQISLLVVILVAAGWGTAQFIQQHSLVFSSLDVALGRQSTARYLTRHLPHYPAARFVQEQLPEDAHLLFIGETRPYYFARKAMAPSAYDRHPLRQWVEDSSSTTTLAARLADEGITHVVLNVREFERLRDAYGVLRFTGTHAEANERRLRQLPSMMRTLFAKHGTFVLEVPRQRGTARNAS